MAGVTPNLSDPLWVPLLSHYRPSGRLDLDRMAEQVKFLRPNVRQFLLGGSTGDGWDLDDTAFEDLVRFAATPGLFGDQNKLLFGLLRPTTEEVVKRAAILARALGICGHPGRTRRGRRLSPDRRACQPGKNSGTLRGRARRDGVAGRPLSIAAGHSLHARAGYRSSDREKPARHNVQDSSGNDVVAKTGAVKGIIALRGAEGHYAEALAPVGPYDGWLLSSGNSFPMALREMAEALDRGEEQKGKELSNRISKAVERLFGSVAGMKFGNVFSNANRSADHLLACGRNWRNAPPPRAHGGMSFQPRHWPKWSKS